MVAQIHNLWAGKFKAGEFQNKLSFLVRMSQKQNKQNQKIHYKHNCFIFLTKFIWASPIKVKNNFYVYQKGSYLQNNSLKGNNHLQFL